MNIAKFFQSRGLSKSVTPRQSKKFYEGSQTPVLYIRLEEPLQDTNQEHLVCSQSLAEDIAAGNLTLKDAEVTFGDNGAWGLVRPDSSTALPVVELW